MISTKNVINIAGIHGCDSVNTYFSDEFADDSEDDKWISKAVRHVEYKKREEKNCKKCSARDLF